jgi:ribose 5-phosphate isomerase B
MKVNRYLVYGSSDFYLLNVYVMRIYMGSDHAGFEYKKVLKDYLIELGHDPVDLGTFNGTESVDYPDFAREVAEKVFENKSSRGLLVCGSGTGMCMAANKGVGVRAVAATTEYLAEYARKHNDANVLCLGSRAIDIDLAKYLTKVFLSTDFEGGRHEVRVKKMSTMEGGEGIHEIKVKHVNDLGTKGE